MEGVVGKNYESVLFEVHFSMWLFVQMVHTWNLAELKVIPIDSIIVVLFSEADLASSFMGNFHLCLPEHY